MAAQKSSQIGDIASEELVSSTKDKRETLYRIVLHRCLPDLVTDLDFSAVSDYIKEMKLFDDSTMLDILNEGEPPDKTRALIKQIEQRNYDTYEKFKQCLVLAKQENVKDMLEHNETIATIQLNTKHEARQTENLHRIVLNRSLPDLVRFLDLYALDDYYRSMRHYDEILGERTTAGKIGLLIKHIKNRGYDTYERFKRCLVMSNQAHVRDMLEKVENIVKIELKTKHEVVRTDTTDIPAEILTMDDQSIRLFTEALKRGTVSVYNIRVMVVGHLGVGKTTLIKRLLGEEVTIGQKLSTDGIVVHVQCCRVSRDTLKWTLNKGDSEQDHRMQLLKKVLNEKQVDKDVDKKPLTYNDSADSVQGKQGLEQFQNSLYKSSINRINRSGLDIDSHKTDPVKETLQIFQTHYATLTPDLGNYAPLTMYDFGGEYAFYTTHQMFITQRAIYLLVSDLGRNISSEVEDVFYFDCEGEIPCSVQKLVEVWMNFIHTCAPPGKETINYTPPDKVIPPPVILVGTHTDAIPQQKRRQECERYFTTIRSHLSDRPSRFHLVNEDFAIDNTVVDSRLEDLKRKIVEVASQQQYWGEKRPAMWLPLEQALMNLKAKGIKVISLGDMEDFNRVGAFHMSSEDLDLFLRFQHDIGTIIYFSTDVLKDNIVLDPQWMIDALTSLITARTFVLTKYVSVADKWLEFERNGKLFPELVDAIWTKENNTEFCDNKKHILLLMEHLNVIAKPRLREKDGSESEANYFFAPCMLRQKTPDEIICPKPDSQMESSSVFCFVFVEKFLPSPIFHRLLAACLTKWPLAKKKGTLENLIFCGSGVFQLDEYHRLTLYFKDYVIFMRVTRKGIRDKTPSSAKCIEVRKFVKAKLVQLIGSPGNNLTFQKFIQCPESNGNDVRNLISVIQLKKEVEAGCDIHEHTLDSRELLKFWYKVEQSGNGDAGQLHEIVLNLCLPTLLKYFDFSLCCDYISQKGLLDEATMRDISTMEPVSEQTRTLIENIQQRGPEIYEIFKECLFKSEQGHLKDDLEKEEARLKGKLHEFVLNRCMPTLLKDFDFSLCCDYINRKGLLDELTMRDISKMNTTSEQTRKLIENIQQRGPIIYEMFKECLVESGQGRLKHILEKEEAQRKGTLHELVLNHCMPSLVKDFIFSPCCDYIVQNELFGGVTMNDIADTNPSSKRTRKLIQKVKQGSPETYEKFKVCLVKSGQEHLKVLLEEEEARCTALSNHELTQAETLGTATKPGALAVAVPTVKSKPKDVTQPETLETSTKTKALGVAVPRDKSKPKDVTQPETLETARKQEALAVAVATVKSKPKDVTQLETLETATKPEALGVAVPTVKSKPKDVTQPETLGTASKLEALEVAVPTVKSKPKDVTQPETLETTTKPEALAVAVPTVKSKPKDLTQPETLETTTKPEALGVAVPTVKSKPKDVTQPETLETATKPEAVGVAVPTVKSNPKDVTQPETLGTARKQEALAVAVPTVKSKPKDVTQPETLETTTKPEALAVAVPTVKSKPKHLTHPETLETATKPEAVGVAVPTVKSNPKDVTQPETLGTARKQEALAVAVPTVKSKPKDVTQPETLETTTKPEALAVAVPTVKSKPKHLTQPETLETAPKPEALGVAVPTVKSKPKDVTQPETLETARKQEALTVAVPTVKSNPKDVTQPETLETAPKPEALAVAVPIVKPKPKGWIRQESKVETKRTKIKGQKPSTSLNSILTITKLSPKCKAPTPTTPDI